MNHRDDALRIVLISGPICSGKSILSKELESQYGATVLKTKDFIKSRSPRIQSNRLALQRAGDRLDRRDGGQWLAHHIQREIDFATSNSVVPSGLFVVDCVRNSGQVEAIRSAYGNCVHHIHLTAASNVLEERYHERDRTSDTNTNYVDAIRNQTERKVEQLATIADTVVPTDRCSKEDVLIRATALLNLYPRSNTNIVDVLVGGQYGSEGKGNIVGYLSPEYNLLIRTGGPNAGHQVYAEPTPEKYFHLPSGTQRAPEAKLLLGPGMVINPTKLLQEIAQHKVTVDRLTIDHQAMTIQEEDIKYEEENFSNIGSTAQGVGVATAHKVTGRSGYENHTIRALARDINALKPYIGSAREVLAEAFVRNKKILLEGTQGTTLSLHHGQYPYVTSRDTTVAGCLSDAGIAPSNVRNIVMVCRTYPIRVAGPSGPLKTEINLDELIERSKIDLDELRA
ncbi:MAG: adenylosuccinate synthase, partial [Gammaproteobacteria bacterium]|nr:adenylosuccinate synthase [Gammaproteobacteria bacterium]